MRQPDGRWDPGSVVVFRWIETPVTAAMVHAIHGDPALIQGVPFLANGKIVTFGARPYIVVKDLGDLVVLYEPENTPLARWEIEDQRYVPDTGRTKGRSLRLLYPSRSYDVTLMFEGEGEPPWFYDSLFGPTGLQAGWRANHDDLQNSVHNLNKGPGTFRGWYVNMETPVARRSYGFDTADLTLDVIVRPDRSWYWKDEDELQLAVSKGACSEEFAGQIRAAGEEVVKLIESAASPFDDEWTSWVPGPNMEIEEIPDGWQDASVLDQG